ncbi:MAG TPA: glycosyl hydrolase family 28-related protein [Kofleriaceae bacterium]|nr:glycosyl hydrolase family 28-related protein [Kofleriaceae bacterium]
MSDVNQRLDRRRMFSMLGAAAGAAALAGCDRTAEGVLAQALADGANVVTVDEIAQLAALSGGPVSHAAGAPPAIAIAQGYRTPGDGGGGVFKWVTSSITAGDGGTRFPAANAGTWIRIFLGALDVRWFGAIADDATAGATNSAAFAAALACPAGSIIVVPKGQFFLAETLRLRRSVILKGEGMNHQTILQLPAGSSVVIEYVTDNPYPATDNNNTVIRDLMIASTGWETGDPASVDTVTFAGASDQAPGLKMNIYSTLENVRIERFGGTGIEIITDLVAGTGNTSWWRIRNCLVDCCGGHGLHVDGGDTNGGLCLGLVVESVGGFGILDSSAGGGTYVGCCGPSGVGGARVAVAAGVGARHTRGTAIVSARTTGEPARPVRAARARPLGDPARSAPLSEEAGSPGRHASPAPIASRSGPPPTKWRRGSVAPPMKTSRSARGGDTPSTPSSPAHAARASHDEQDRRSPRPRSSVIRPRSGPDEKSPICSRGPAHQPGHALPLLTHGRACRIVALR